MKEIRLTAPAMSSEDAAALAGQQLTKDSYHTLVDEDTTVYMPDGRLLLVFIKDAIPEEVWKPAYGGLRAAAVKTDNRGVAGGVLDADKVSRNLAQHGFAGVAKQTKTRYYPQKLDGTASKTNYANIVNSGVVGYMDRHVRFPYCRTTAYTVKHLDRFKKAMPFFITMSNLFEKHVPERWAAQKEICDRTHPDFVIPKTVFTTVTVIKNWPTAVHTDKGDYAEGFGCLAAFTEGEYEGCIFVFPEWGVGVNMRSGNALFADVHQWHGNTPSEAYNTFERISTVLYYRANMVHCESADEELLRAQNRREGDALN